MGLKSCIRTLVDDAVRFVALCEIIAAVASLALAGMMAERDDVFKSGDWKHPRRSWFVDSVALYGLLMLLSGSLGMVGSSKCKGFCLDLHALVTILLVSAQSVVVCVFFADRSALEGLGAKDPYGDLTAAIAWIEHNSVGSIAIAATVFSVQLAGFLLAWSVRLCCRAGGHDPNAHEDFEEFEYEYAPLPPTQDSFEFSKYGEGGPQAPNRTLSNLQKKYAETFKQAGPAPQDGLGRPLLGQEAASAVPYPTVV